MAEPAYASSTGADAWSIPGATVGAAATLGAEATIDLSAYAGRWVKLYSEDDGFRFVFEDADNPTTLVLGAAPVGTAGVPDGADAGFAGIHRIVPRKTPVLRHAAAGGGGTIRIIPV